MYERIVGIVGAPRSGTSWTGQIFDSAPGSLYRMQPFYSYAFRDKIHVRSSKEEINNFFNEMYLSKDPYLSQEDRRNAGVYPVFEEQEENPKVMVYKEVMFHYMLPVIIPAVDSLEILAIVRHPIEVVSSYYNAPREFDPSLDIQKEWYFAQTRNELLPERYFGYFKWKEYMSIVSCMKEKYPDRVTVVKYEDLAVAPLDMITELFEKYGIPLTKQTEDFIYNSQHSTVKDPYAVFRDVNAKKEKKSLPDNIIEAIKKDLETFDIAKEYGYQ